MLAMLVLWSHSLAALLYGALAIWVLRRRHAGVPRRALAAALVTTALWALAVAGIGPRDMATRLAEAVSSVTWLGFMFLLQRRAEEKRAPFAMGAVYAMVALVTITALAIGLIGTVLPAAVAAQFEAAALILRILGAIAALVLVQALYSVLALRGSGRLQTLVLALGGIWLVDLNVFSFAYLSADVVLPLAAARGVAMALLATCIAAGMQRPGERGMQVSRTIAYQSLTLIAIGLYFAFLALATSLIAAVGGDKARILQTAFVFGSTAAILTFLSTPWLRAWTRVKLAKHFFRHRYDYRAEWIRFTGTLGAPEGAARLDERMVKAVADLIDSPAGLLLVPEGAGLGLGAAWNWERGTLPAIAADETLARYLSASGRIIELDAVRAGRNAEDGAAVPHWMVDLMPAWVLVPLPHLGTLAGAILLARPPVPRALDWEDFDLLKIAGRQAASYLAEARAQEALAEAERFDEFNRRFAFILHDIKNLVSQLALLARNAERHADNPEFRADMIASLRESAGRMNALLARLSQHHRARGEEALRPVEVAPLVRALAGAHGARHPVVTSITREAIALADPARLEQLLGHLVENAIDASAAHEPVTLAINADGTEVTIDVVDRGCGMSPAFVRDKLFKPFVSSKPAGFGIGAYEARQLATGMGGRIEVTSREGQGSRFRVVLPAAQLAEVDLAKEDWGRAA